MAAKPINNQDMAGVSINERDIAAGLIVLAARLIHGWDNGICWGNSGQK